MLTSYSTMLVPKSIFGCFIFVAFNTIFSACDDYCKNGGTLTAYDQFCQCPVGFHGSQCQHKICPPRQLENSTGDCACSPGFTGTNCDEIDSCWNGFAPSLERKGYCNCNDPTNSSLYSEVFIGTLCDRFHTLYEELHCLPGTTSLDFENLETTCNCMKSYTGRYCNRINACENGGTPIEVGFTPTYWGPADGNMVAMVQKCQCNPPFTGELCEYLACVYGKIVTKQADSNATHYECVCDPPYTGDYCDQVKFCLNDGVIEFDKFLHKNVCNCTDHYTGPGCEIPICRGSTVLQ